MDTCMYKHIDINIDGSQVTFLFFLISETFILTYFHTNNPKKVQYQLFFFVCLFVYTAGSYQSSILYTSVYTCQSQSPNSAHHHHPHPTAVFPPWCPYVCSLRLCLNFCPALLCVSVCFALTQEQKKTICSRMQRTGQYVRPDNLTFLLKKNKIRLKMVDKISQSSFLIPLLSLKQYKANT